MPVYLVHGFRWPRDGYTGIRVHAILNNLEDVSVEYIQNSHSRADILRSFRKAFPDIMKELDHTDLENDGQNHNTSNNHTQPAGGVGSTKPGSGRRLEFIEQYNPDDLDGPYAVSQPFAYVGDKVVVIATTPGLGAQFLGGESPTSTQKKPPPPPPAPGKPAVYVAPTDGTALSVNVDEVIADGPGLTNKAWEALADLRDKIAEGEKIGWWVVYNGDPDRSFDDLEEDEDDEMLEDDEEEEEGEENEHDAEMEDVVPGEPQQGGGGGGEPSVKRPATAASSSTPAPQPPRPGSSPATTTTARGHRPTGSESAPIPMTTPAPAMPGRGNVPRHIATQSQDYYQRQQQQQQNYPTSPGLTALPVRASPQVLAGPFVPSSPTSQQQQQQQQQGAAVRSRPNTSASSPPDKDKEKLKAADASKGKDGGTAQASKLQGGGLRRKLFGRRS